MATARGNFYAFQPKPRHFSGGSFGAALSTVDDER